MARQAEEQERQRQLQLAQKLELMRQKKREFLESQRAATLARMAESQAAMQAKLWVEKYNFFVFVRLNNVQLISG